MFHKYKLLTKSINIKRKRKTLEFIVIFQLLISSKICVHIYKESKHHISCFHNVTMVCAFSRFKQGERKNIYRIQNMTKSMSSWQNDEKVKNKINSTHKVLKFNSCQCMWTFFLDLQLLFSFFLFIFYLLKIVVFF